MFGWKGPQGEDAVLWLLEDDASQPGVRFFALRDLMEIPAGDASVRKTQEAIMSSGPVPAILAAQADDGHWGKPGPGYSPKYIGTVWQIIFMAQLGADSADPRVRKGCEYLLSHCIAGHGGFAYNGLPAGFLHCLSGNLCSALADLGYLDDPRLQAAIDWEARTVTGCGVADIADRGVVRRYYAYSPGPGYVCGPNYGLPCGWGAVKSMVALGKVPISRRTAEISAAIEQGIKFLLLYDIAAAAYPFGSGEKPSSSWFKFGFPLGYIADVLQVLEALVALGEAQNPKLTEAVDFILSKRDAAGRWKLENTYRGKMWADIEQKGKPSKWVTLRAMRVLKTVYS